MFLQVSVCPQGGSTWASTPPGRYIPLGKYTPGQVHPQAGTSLAQVHPLATVHAGIWSTSGRYASHWNAFLYFVEFIRSDESYEKLEWIIYTIEVFAT